MKTLRPRTFIVFALVAVLGALLLHVSQNVQKAEDVAASLEASIAREDEQIRILKAEWEHLNNPARLERLAEKFLDLAPPAPERITGRASDDAISALPDYVGAEEGVSAEPPLRAQPVSVSSENKAVPKPAVKPIFARPSKRSIQKPTPSKPIAVKDEKAFDALLNELGGDR